MNNENYRAITITLTRQQMSQIAAEYDLICRTDDVMLELNRQLRDMFDNDGKPIDSKILSDKGITKSYFVDKCNAEELAERFEDEYDWEMDGPSIMHDMVRDRIREVEAELSEVSNV